MKDEDSFSEKLFASGKDALNPLNLLVRFLMFIVFGVLTAFKYVISNLNEITDVAVGSSLIIKIWYFFRALAGATWKGMFIGFSSFFSTFLDVTKGIYHYGDIFYACLVLVFGIWVIYQPLSVIFDIADMQKGKHYSKAWAFLTALVLLVVVISPISYVALDGETLTSDINKPLIIDNTTYVNETNVTSGLIINIDLTGSGGDFNETG